MESQQKMDVNIDLSSTELSSLNFTIIDQQSLEDKVEKALDDAVASHSKKQQLNIMKSDEMEARQEVRKLLQKKEDLGLRLKSMQTRFTDPRNVIAVQKQITETEQLIISGRKREAELNEKLAAPGRGIAQMYLPEETETEKEKLKEKTDMIKTGEMTPFGTIINNSSLITSKKMGMAKKTVKSSLTDFEKYISDQMNRQKSIKKSSKFESKSQKIKEQAIRTMEAENINITSNISSRKRKRDESYSEATTSVEKISSSVVNKLSDESDYAPSDAELSSDSSNSVELKEKKKRTESSARRTKDDGDMAQYTKRIKHWKTQRLLDVQSGKASLRDEFHRIGNGYKMPADLWEALYKFQRTGVQWLWELHSQQCGGIMGDEMGLGKTIQVIAFLIGLSVSRLPCTLGNWSGLGPVLIICPATVLKQWLKEFHKWGPQFRVAILHGSGSFTGNRSALIHNINRCNGIVLTSYTGARAQLRTLIQYQWHYVILDEGHHIRNPAAQITVAVKRIDTPHRLILSGSPIQNSLKELWSLFDFIYPGKLGTLPVFLQQFAVPITQGGYSNASKLQVQTAYRCATVLRDTISPYLLRRMKSDLRSHLNLPDKNEQVLFCGLTDEQRKEYKLYLDTDELKMIFKGRLMAFVGLITLRKICNHPDIYNGGPRDSICSDLQPETQYGYWKRSGKMVVLQAILKLWNKQGHRVLLFTQSRQMLKILSNFMQAEEYTYFKMDGSTTVSSRQRLIDKFNGDDSIFVFLLTTRVGGLGVNLTGADRVVIFDPDWNPSTDLQARERAWRIGQRRHVTIYRLLTAGTIEEKIYHRQIFKQFITNRVLKDPKQQRFFKTSGLNDLFSLTDGDKVTETSALFAGTGSEIKPNSRKRMVVCDEKSDYSNELVEDQSDTDLNVSQEDKGSQQTEAKALQEMQEDEDDSKEIAVQSDYEQQMRKLAKLLSKKIVEQCKLKKPKKEKKGKKFEGSRIRNLVKKRTFKECASAEQTLHTDQDEYVLKKLFKKSGVHSAYSHDTIVEGNGTDHLLLEAEANRVAQDALKKVKASRSFCTRPHVSGRVIKKRRFGVKSNARIETSPLSCASRDVPESTIPAKGNRDVLTSSQLLAKMKFRNVQIDEPATVETTSDFEEDVEMLNGDDETDENVLLLSDIRKFMASQSTHNGNASTQEILDKFRDQLPPQKSLIFKTLLNKICDFAKNSEGIGIWSLKADFR